eukprot:272735_1
MRDVAWCGWCNVHGVGGWSGWRWEVRVVGSSWRDGDCSDLAGCDGGWGGVGLVGVGCPYLGEIVAEEHAGEEWKGRGGMVEGANVVVEVGRVGVEARVGGQVVGVAKELEVGGEGGVVAEMDSVVMGDAGDREVREVEGDRVIVFIIMGVEVPANGWSVGGVGQDDEAG